MQKDAEPAAKRQKRSPKPRETEFLDLRSPSPEAPNTNQKRQLDTLLKLLHKKKKIVVIAGAGISVGAGIPDFRSSNGLFTTLSTAKNSGKDLFDASVYRDDELTSSFHDMVRTLHSMAAEAEPTEFHQLLATLATEGRLLRLYSQNVDCIETRLEPLKTTIPLQLKGPWPRTVQVHGGLEKMNCSKCGWVGEFEPKLFVGAQPPECRECLELESVRGVAGKRSLGVGKLRPRIVLYNEFHPDGDAIGAVTAADIKARPDAVIVVGTSLKVPGIKRIVQEMCKTVADTRGGISVWVNNHDPPSAKDYSFDLVVKGDCEKVARLAKLPRWDGSDSEGSDGSFTELDPNELRISNQQVEVQIPHLPSPSLSPDPHTIVAPEKKSRKRPAAIEKEKPAKKARTKTTAKSAKKAAGNIKTTFKSGKAKPPPKTKAAGSKKTTKLPPLVVSEDVVAPSSPPPSVAPSPTHSVRSIPISMLINQG
ncbi:Sir2 family histone deacetylase Hst4 [Sphaerosporella brunnea]|uniref:Sir2 family histone deacetylase Hst4 n=1 Tax=Sphaerosporella brunnea TaxID=1250544 RepID=A0A5J5F095_9PEZI|nr:Sir2 family histone deacetylase Hst4 [Sphaerosporella brunnea]